jgi:methyltransferase-like protein/SAM-dependent methyltransferase
MDAAQRSSYDDVPYASFPFAQTHPDRMATLARLFGLQPPPLATCRVVELGCASGGNLIPMAIAMPQAEFFGVDLSPVQVAEGQAVIDALGLRNIRLLAMSIADVDARLGGFDYLLTHGVYSWVPNAVQEKILAICAEQLAPNGVAYVSYNTLPGWRMRGMIRDLMRYHALPFARPEERVGQARAILDFLARWVPTENNAYGLLLKSELEALRRQPDYYILHEHLEDTNEPLYFHEFAERAGRHGLQYLAEAEFGTMLASNFPAEAGETVRRIAPDVIRQEQFMDFLRNRTFRQTLLVRADAAVNRNVAPERIEALWVAGSLQPEGTLLLAEGELVSFRAPAGSLRTPHAITKAATRVMAEQWPRALSIDEVFERSLKLLAADGAGLPVSPDAARSTLLSDLLQCYAAGLVELHGMASPFVVEPGERPRAHALARWQAAQGRPQLTSLRHQMVGVDENLRRLLPLLDGSRDRDGLFSVVRGWVSEGRQAPAAAVRQRVDQAIGQLARAGLLIG